jgi:hypothetical protein
MLALSFENTVTFIYRFSRYMNFYAGSMIWSYATWLQLTCNLMRASMELMMKTVPPTGCLNLMEGWMVCRQRIARVVRMGYSHRSKGIMGTLSSPIVNGNGGDVMGIGNYRIWRIFHRIPMPVCPLLPLHQRGTQEGDVCLMAASHSTPIHIHSRDTALLSGSSTRGLQGMWQGRAREKA